LVKRWEHGDRLVYLGNYLGRGPDITGVLDELLSFRINRLCMAGMMAEDIVFLRGAQEEMWRKLLQIQLASDPQGVFDWMVEQGIGNTLQAYGESEDEVRRYFREGILATTKWANRLRLKIQNHPGHDDLLISLRRAAFTEGGELLFVHAGIDPGKPIIEQSDTFWWGSNFFSRINQPYAGFHKIIRGFEPGHKGTTITEYTTTIDGGCGFGGPLIAACFNLEGGIDDEISID
jgi:serine/threonine protein phosphatase 1